MKIILCGNSSCGKDFALKRLVELTGIPKLITCTTRPIRVNENNGTDYHFLSDEEFKQAVANNQFLEWREYNAIWNGQHQKWWYGTRLSDLSADFITVLDLQGAALIKNHFPDAMVIFILCPYYVALERAKQRGSFQQAEFQRRWQSDDEQFEKYHHVIDITLWNGEKNAN